MEKKCSRTRANKWTICVEGRPGRKFDNAWICFQSREIRAARLKKWKIFPWRNARQKTIDPFEPMFSPDGSKLLVRAWTTGSITAAWSVTKYKEWSNVA
jgi:hypothetical protein